jgi:hypothetical protein
VTLSIQSMAPFTASFRALRRFMGPSWLVADDEESTLVGYSLDLLKDAFVQRLWLGHLARFPETAVDDALVALGRDRRVIRGINESTASYVARLLTWLDDRKKAGNPFALMKALAGYCGPLPKFRTVDANGNWYTREANGTESFSLARGNWNWDDKPTVDPFGAGKERWSRFWVIIYPNGLWSEYPYNWGNAAGPDWTEGTQSWGSTATKEQVETIRFIVSDWKPANARCVNIIVAFDNASFPPTAGVNDAGMPAGLWERWSKNVGGVQVPARLSTARYWDGVS